MRHPTLKGDKLPRPPQWQHLWTTQRISTCQTTASSLIGKSRTGMKMSGMRMKKRIRPQTTNGEQVRKGMDRGGGQNLWHAWKRKSVILWALNPFRALQRPLLTATVIAQHRGHLPFRMPVVRVQMMKCVGGPRLIKSRWARAKSVVCQFRQGHKPSAPPPPVRLQEADRRCPRLVQRMQYRYVRQCSRLGTDHPRGQSPAPTMETDR